MATDDAPGWDAIDHAIRPLVGSVEPLHRGTGTMLPDQDGLWGISGYRRSDHWFFVTYGLTELFGKVTEQPEVSGWGTELTMRVSLGDTNEPPPWAPRLLGRLGELVFQRTAPFAPGGRLEIPGNVNSVPPVLCWTEDPELPGSYGSPNGAFAFTATLGISSELLEVMRESSTREVVDGLRATNPLLAIRGPGLTW